MNVRSRTYRRVCYFCNLHALQLYLLYSTEEQIRNTLFIAHHYSPNLHLPHCRFMPHYFRFDTWWKRLLRALGLGFLVPFFGHKRLWAGVSADAEFFAQDHADQSYLALGRRDYVLLEDSRGFLRYVHEGGGKYFENPPKWKIPLLRLLFGHSVAHRGGTSKHCKGIVVTYNDLPQILQHLPITEINLYDLWNDSSESKRALIQSIFRITEAQLATLRSATHIVFTQGLNRYVDFTGEQEAAIYRALVAQYPGREVLVKVHPLDGNDYRKTMPNIPQLYTDAPMQLLSYMVQGKWVGITLFSTSVSYWKGFEHIDWYGTELSQKMLQRWGHLAPIEGATQAYLPTDVPRPWDEENVNR